MQILGYFILVFGVVGILLGVYGLFMPSARKRGFSLNLPRPRLPGKGEDVDQLIAELEQSGFRNSPFEARMAAPAVVKPPSVARGPGAAPRPRPAVPAAPAVKSVAASSLDDDDEDGPPPPSLPLRGYDDEEEEELDPVVAELLAEVQAAQEAAALEAPVADAFAFEDAPEEPAPADGEAAPDAMLNLFAETVVESRTSEALRNAVPQVAIEGLLAQAREMRALLADPKSRNRVA